MHACSEPLRPTGGYRGHYLIFRGRVNLLKRKKLGITAVAATRGWKGVKNIHSWRDSRLGVVKFSSATTAPLPFNSNFRLKKHKICYFSFLRHFSSFASLFLSLSLSLSVCVCTAAKRVWGWLRWNGLKTSQVMADRFSFECAPQTMATTTTRKENGGFLRTAAVVGRWLYFLSASSSSFKEQRRTVKSLPRRIRGRDSGSRPHCRRPPRLRQLLWLFRSSLNYFFLLLQRRRMLNKSRDREANTSSFSLLFSSFDALNVEEEEEESVDDAPSLSFSRSVGCWWRRRAGTENNKRRIEESKECCVRLQPYKWRDEGGREKKPRSFPLHHHHHDKNERSWWRKKSGPKAGTGWRRRMKNLKTRFDGGGGGGGGRVLLLWAFVSGCDVQFTAFHDDISSLPLYGLVRHCHRRHHCPPPPLLLYSHTHTHHTVRAKERILGSVSLLSGSRYTNCI